jgi:hypothetical protein
VKGCAGKRRFPDEHTAKDALVQAKIRRSLHGSSKRRERRAYECPDCHGWHLTSSDEWRGVTA